LFNKIIILLLFSTLLFCADETSSALIKQRIEVKELKKELNSFYNQKEKEYQDRKKELERILDQIKKEKAEIQALHDKNLTILQDMTETVNSKTAKIYNSMKPKVSASIFNEMISDGRIEDVFDIILKLKEKNVTLLMKYLSVPNAAKLTLMLENFKVENKKG
tara:strand:- start:5098 stop:5586 length:489 start_codon:yes stop_codon:yes gene_type:complete